MAPSSTNGLVEKGTASLGKPRPAGAHDRSGSRPAPAPEVGDEDADDLCILRLGDGMRQLRLVPTRVDHGDVQFLPATASIRGCGREGPRAARVDLPTVAVARGPASERLREERLTNF